MSDLFVVNRPFGFLIMSDNPRKYRTAVVFLTWNDLPFLRRTLETFESLNGNYPAYVVDNGSTDGTRHFLQRKSWYQVIGHDKNLGVFDGTFSGWERALVDGYDFILNVQSDFPSLRKVPLLALESYLDENEDVGFIRLNDKIDLNRNSSTRERIVFRKREEIGDGFKIAQYNYHMAFHPYLFRASLIPELRVADPRREKGLMKAYAQLQRLGARIWPACFGTLMHARHATKGWRA